MDNLNNELICQILKGYEKFKANHPNFKYPPGYKKVDYYFIFTDKAIWY